MVFSSSIFLFLFLPIVFGLNFFIKDKYSNVLLLIASIVFYAWGEPILVLLMIASIIFNWIIGLLISNVKSKTKSLVLIFGIFVNLKGVLL